MVPKPPAKSSIASTVNDFVVLPLQLTPKASYAQHATHYLYLRPNAPKVPSESTPREVFLVNVPVDTTEAHVKHLFASQLGGARVESVAFEGARVGKGISAPVAPAVQSGKKRKRDVTDEEGATEAGALPEVWDRHVRRSGSSAIVTFVDQESAKLAMKEAKRAIKSKAEITWGEGLINLPSLGSARYKTHHALRFPDHAALQDSVDAFMASFAAQEEARAKQLARLRNEPDADGFITVTRGGRQGPGRAEEARAKEEEFKKREKSRIKEDFYRFQTREKRKEEQQGLVHKFEEDRRRVEEMRKRRGKLRPE
ncbi:Putative ribosomal RNA-processing protein [Septoria linicola]|uniref:Ribosomal RNA-processing protein n=1 Tax=Septoria linicola TaxID=215465 RepID=A0A9Q9EKX5_9PEZI|nr:putative ribosomal RNA-processing protein [Septoria linicola]USW53729.1 Putative ribosomal RNA-processing protein [Septoria linicola]